MEQDENKIDIINECEKIVLDAYKEAFGCVQRRTDCAHDFIISKVALDAILNYIIYDMEEYKR